jgi:Polysaccharide lyase
VGHRGCRRRRRRPSLRVFGLVAIAVLVSALPASAGVTWRGGFESGTFSEWDTLQAKPGGATIVTAPVREGRYAARFRVGSGDNPLRCSCGERAELVKHAGEKPGTTSVWAWSAYFPPEFAVRPGKRVVFTQWHDYGAGHPAPVVVRVVSVNGEDRLGLGVLGGPVAQPIGRDWTFGRLERGRWYDFVARIRWASDATGSIELMIDGAWVVPRTSTPTLFVENGAKGVYVKQGVYRATPWSQTTVAYLDGMRRGDTLADVLAS